MNRFADDASDGGRDGKVVERSFHLLHSCSSNSYIAPGYPSSPVSGSLGTTRCGHCLVRREDQQQIGMLLKTGKMQGDEVSGM